MHMDLNEFLTAVFHTFADENDAENFGSTAFWRRQYEMWNSGIRGVDIHDQTCKVMAHYDGRNSADSFRDGVRLDKLPEVWR